MEGGIEEGDEEGGEGRWMEGKRGWEASGGANVDEDEGHLLQHL